MEIWADTAVRAWEAVLAWLTSGQFYAQLAFTAGAAVLAFVTAVVLKARFKFAPPGPEADTGFRFKAALARTRELLFPILAILFLGVAIELSAQYAGQDWVVRIGQGLAVVLLIYYFISHFITNPTVSTFAKWVGIPVALLYVLGWLDDVAAQLDSVSLEVGNINFSAFDLARTVFFGTILFWLGRVSNTTGKQVIRAQPALDAGTRELIAKLFEIGLYVLLFVLLLQVIGINLTALAVFGGAVGVGLGFGLQQIAANFISGIIILLDRSVTIDDYVQLEDGRAGRIREMSMRCATLETFDGKDIIVPNEQFITTAFTNWTHNNKKQRYSFEFQVAYKTDLPAMIDIVRDVVASHPKVLSGPGIPIEERADAEIASFGDSGVNILVEFWMEGIDDGVNRVGADLLLMIWTALKEHRIEIPFPQREVRLLDSKK